MTEHELIKQLKTLKRISPREEFCRTSLSLITNAPRATAPRMSFVYFLERAGAIGLAGFIITIATIALNVVSTQSPLVLQGANITSIIAEANSIDITIDLPELQYENTISAPPKKPQKQSLSVQLTTSSISTLSELEADDINNLLEELSK